MIEKKSNYRKIYGYENIPEGWEVHHIDWESINNNKSNLIAVPKIVHRAIHSFGGSVLIDSAYGLANYFEVDPAFIFERQFLEYLLKIYTKHKSKKEDDLLVELEKGFEKMVKKNTSKIIVSDERIKQDNEFILAQDKFLEKHPEISDQDILKLRFLMDEEGIINLFNDFSPNEFEVMMAVYNSIFESND